MNKEKHKGKLIIALLLTFISYSLPSKLLAAPAKWTIKQCVDTALIKNTSLLQSQNSVYLNQLAYQQSKNYYLPAISLSASESNNGGRTLNPVNYQFINQNTWNTSLSLSGSMTLFSGMQNINTIRQNAANYQASASELENNKNNLVISVINAFLQLVYAIENEKVAIAQVDYTQETLEHTRIMVESGKSSQNEIHNVRSQLASDKYNLSVASGQVKTSSLNLQQLINIPYSPDFGIDYGEMEEPRISIVSNPESLFAKSMRFHPTVIDARNQVLSSEYGIRIARGAYLPRLSLNGNLNSNYSNGAYNSSVSYENSLSQIGYLQSNPSENVLGFVSTPVYSQHYYRFGDQLKDNFGRSFSFTLSVPIFSGMQTRYNVKRQYINYQNALLNEQITTNSLRKNIEQSYVDAENAITLYYAAKEAAEASDLANKNATEKYNAGALNSDQLLLQNQNYLKAQKELLQARYELIFKLKILDYYDGIPLTY